MTSTIFLTSYVCSMTMRNNASIFFRIKRARAWAFSFVSSMSTSQGNTSLLRCGATCSRLETLTWVLPRGLTLTAPGIRNSLLDSRLFTSTPTIYLSMSYLKVTSKRELYTDLNPSSSGNPNALSYYLTTMSSLSIFRKKEWTWLLLERVNNSRLRTATATSVWFTH